MYIVSSVITCPITCCIIALLVGLQIRSSYTHSFNPMHVYFNYENLVNRKQYWRVVSSAIYHESMSHLVLNVVALWSYKFIEVRLGSLLFLGYTLLFMTANRWIGIALGYYSNRIRGYLLSSIGYSDVVVAWSFYVAVNNFRGVVFILDIFPVSAYIVALVLLNLALLFSSVVNRPSLCYIAMCTGAILGLGLELLPTPYWAVSFILDASLVFLWSLSVFPISSQGEDNAIEANVDQALEDALRASREASFGVAGVVLPNSGEQGGNRNIVSWNRVEEGRAFPADSDERSMDSSNYSRDENV